MSIRADRAFQRRLVESYDNSPDVSAADVGANVRRYRSYDGLRQATFVRLIDDGGPRAVDALGSMDDAAARRFVDADASYSTRQQFLQIADDDAAEIVESFDEETLNAYLDRNLVTRGPIREPDIPGSGPSPIRDGGERSIQYTLAEQLWDGNVGRGLAESDVPFADLKRNIDDLTNAGRESDLTTLGIRRDGLDARVEYFDDGSDRIRRLIDDYNAGDGQNIFEGFDVDSVDDIDTLSKQEWYRLRGRIGEEVVAEDLFKRKGYEVIDPPFDFGSSESGFDTIARDPQSGKLVIAEVKVRNGDPVEVKDTKAWLKRPNKGKQLSDEWIRATLDDLESKDLTPRHEQFVQNIRDALDSGNVKKEYVAIHDRPKQGITVDGSMKRNVGVEEVDVIYSGRWFADKSPVWTSESIRRLVPNSGPYPTIGS